VIVVDASVAAFALLDEGSTGEICREAMRADPQWMVPEHWLIEIMSVIRGNLLGGKISAEQADFAAGAAAELNPTMVATRLLAPRIWALRATLSCYDAAYVAAAERCGCALVTADGRLAPGPRCPVVVIA